MRKAVVTTHAHWAPIVSEGHRCQIGRVPCRRSPRLGLPPRATDASLPSTSSAASSAALPVPFFVDKDPCKLFRVEPLTAETIGQASVVITRAFAASPQYIPINECKTYCNDMLAKDDAEGIIFVGSILPGPECVGGEAGFVDVPDADPARPPRVVATASLSFCDTSRESFKSLKPPDDAPYLCNIAVDPAFRRKGIARRMLIHVEDYCREHGWSQVYLHVRLGDDAARSLYDTSGYVEVASDSWLVKLQNRTPNALLCKTL
jgi:GNAT superfamily N-acetyltransferase